MRIVLIGQAAFGKEVFQTLLSRGEDVVGIFVPPDKPGGEADALGELGREVGVPVFAPRRMREPEVSALYEKLAPNLGIMAFVTDIVPEAILRYPKFGTIQYHPSLLPKHRGGNAIQWAIINGETKTGITIFWPDGGIDTGPIILQKEVEISPDDTAGSLYYNKLFGLGVEALMEALELVKSGDAPRIAQDESQATYEGLCREEDCIIDWSQAVSRIYNLIRGSKPQPGASTLFRGKHIKVFDSKLLDIKPEKLYGEVIECSESGFVVAGHDGAIMIERVQPDGASKVKASEYARQVDLKVGDRLGR